MKSTAIVLLSISLLSACISFNKVTPEQGASVTGLRTVLNRGRPTSMLFVHGMGVHEPGYSDELQRRFSAGLSLSPPAPLTNHEIKRNGVLVGHLRTRQAQDSNGVQKLRFVELTWSTLTTAIKLELLELEPGTSKETTPLEEGRLKVNSFAKAFINSRFTDAVLYSGKLKGELNSIVAEAICAVSTVSEYSGGECVDLNAIRDEPHDIVLVAQSLGSAMVFDTLAQLGLDASEDQITNTPYGNAARHTAANTRYLYLLANQLPLIELSNLTGPIEPDWLTRYPCENVPETPALHGRRQDRSNPTGMGGFLVLRSNTNKDASDILEITALSDPNDVLTYWLTKRFKQRCASDTVKINNVTVRNARIKWFFIYADVIEAHTGFELNQKVIDFLIDGT